MVASSPSCSTLLVPNKDNDLEVLTSKPAREMYQRLSQIYAENEHELKVHFVEDMTITEALEVFKKFVPEEEIDQFVDKSISTILKMVFAGSVNQMSASMMLSRYLKFVK